MRRSLTLPQEDMRSVYRIDDFPEVTRTLERMKPRQRPSGGRYGPARTAIVLVTMVWCGLVISGAQHMSNESQKRQAIMRHTVIQNCLRGNQIRVVVRQSTGQQVPLVDCAKL